jgi:putative tryptophan/tyrosine transport system substrate-binding protein
LPCWLIPGTTPPEPASCRLDGKRQDILIDMLPGASRLAALADPNTTPPAQLQALAEAACSRGVMLLIHRADRAEEITPAIDAARAAGAQALNVLGAAFFAFKYRQIIEHVAIVGLPAVYQLQSNSGEP